MAQRIYGISPDKVISFIQEIDTDRYYGSNWGDGDPKSIVMGVSKLPTNDQGLINCSKIGHYLMEISTNKLPGGANKAINRVRNFIRENKEEMNTV